MALFRVPFVVEEFGYIYFEVESEELADELLAECEKGVRDVEDLPNSFRRIMGGSESIEGWNVEEVS
jgi:hypothetical protein